MTPQAAAAIRAAKNLPRWGIFATSRYCLKNGVSPRLYALALRLEYGKIKAIMLMYGGKING